MPAYQELPEEELRELLDAYEVEAGELAATKKAEDAYVRNSVCFRCGGSVRATYPGDRTVFTGGGPQPRYNLECKLCGAEFTTGGILLKLGNMGAAMEVAMAQQTPWINPYGEEE